MVILIIGAGGGGGSNTYRAVCSVCPTRTTPCSWSGHQTPISDPPQSRRALEWYRPGSHIAQMSRCRRPDPSDRFQARGVVQREARLRQWSGAVDLVDQTRSSTSAAYLAPRWFDLRTADIAVTLSRVAVACLRVAGMASKAPMSRQ